mmetsp:Transcript_47207/g.156465  ORF Transcript_47207/g.156465 Transcript_47207/m.156465 type:complete len:211 (+) Transcript_47207:32-664(+)
MDHMDEPSDGASTAGAAHQTWERPPDLSALNLYGWSWSSERSVDANLLDLAYLVARNSTCKDGHMGCVLARGVPNGRGGETAAALARDPVNSVAGAAGTVCPPCPPGAPQAAADGAEASPAPPLCPSVVLCATNAPLFGAHRSDCHAEALAVSECARRGIGTAGLSIYVTRTPCGPCYKLLAAAGVARIVSPTAKGSGRRPARSKERSTG